MRRVLFDEDVPRQLRRDLTEFSIRTVQEQGWASLKNGELLRTACESFDVFLTADKNLQYQQHIPKFDIGVVVLALVDTRLPSLQARMDDIRTAIRDVSAGSLIRIGR